MHHKDITSSRIKKEVHVEQILFIEHVNINIKRKQIEILYTIKTRLSTS